MEWNPVGGNVEGAIWRGLHIGKELVRARNEALAYLGFRDAENQAQIVTCVIDGGQSVRFYSHHASHLPDGTMQYYHAQIDGEWTLTESSSNFQIARELLLNLQYRAMRCSIRLCSAIQERALRRLFGPALHVTYEHDP
ncbi:hypothetical protein F5Y17DRAFT_416101 [Xylariaceae sp. FL0594]|nr:hypothetical protein F5Y17DRAFT_416101 [Xylariaceae sp. FL0594]